MNFDPSLDEQFSLVKNKEELQFLHREDDDLPDVNTRKRYAVHHEGDLMDRTVFRGKFWFKISSKTGSFDDTYIKVDGHLDVIHVLRAGVGSIFGNNQEAKTQRMGLDL